MDAEVATAAVAATHSEAAMAAAAATDAEAADALEPASDVEAAAFGGVAAAVRRGALAASARLQAVWTQVPTASFPLGAGTELGRYLDAVVVDAVGLDWMVELGFARNESDDKLLIGM